MEMGTGECGHGKPKQGRGNDGTKGHRATERMKIKRK